MPDRRLSPGPAAARLRSDGFVVIGAAELQGGGQFGPALEAVIAEFDALPPDPYGLEENRYRAHSRGIYLPWRQHLEWLPERVEAGEHYTEYYQGRYHPDFADRARMFRAVSAASRGNRLIQHLIRHDFALTFWNEFHARQPLQVGISFIKLLVRPGQDRAVSTPDALHQDGETFTFAHLIRRTNCMGGQNVIASPADAGRNPDTLAADRVIASFCLEHSLDSYAVHDLAVSHYVGPIEPVSRAIPAERSILLIDFTPLVAEHLTVAIVRS